MSTVVEKKYITCDVHVAAVKHHCKTGQVVSNVRHLYRYVVNMPNVQRQHCKKPNVQQQHCKRTLLFEHLFLSSMHHVFSRISDPTPISTKEQSRTVTRTNTYLKLGISHIFQLHLDVLHQQSPKIQHRKAEHDTPIGEILTFLHSVTPKLSPK